MYGDLMDESGGFDYHFFAREDYRAQEDARRAVFAKYQSYPQNSVAGGGTLVVGAQGGLPGSMWREFQPAQAYQFPDEILADMLGGGIDTGSLVSQPLISGG